MLKAINLDAIKKIVYNAGRKILTIYEKDFEVIYKDDKSPLTEADTISNKIICSQLKELYPAIPILSEENKEVAFEIRKNWEYYWCIDPIDGTKEFIKKNGEFTINIALIHRDIPVLGVVYAPVLNKMYYSKKGEGAYLNGEKLPLNITKNNFNIVASKSHLSKETEDFIELLRSTYENLELVSKGSSLKLCMVAEGIADIYPRLAPTMEWDTAAAHAIVLESGKNVYLYNEDIDPQAYFSSEDLVSLKYNKKNLLNPFFVVA
jgi:3'(2'), 5'-bisphosphate nucleotidase